LGDSLQILFAEIARTNPVKRSLAITHRARQSNCNSSGLAGDRLHGTAFHVRAPSNDPPAEPEAFGCWPLKGA